MSIEIEPAPFISTRKADELEHQRLHEIFEFAMDLAEFEVFDGRAEAMEYIRAKAGSLTLEIEAAERINWARQFEVV